MKTVVKLFSICILTVLVLSCSEEKKETKKNFTPSEV
jgi:hypothetical protein